MVEYKKVTVDAKWYEDEDDCLAAAENEYAEEHDLATWQVSASWVDDSREEIALRVPAEEETCPRCGHPTNNSSGHGGCTHPSHEGES